MSFESTITLDRSPQSIDIMMNEPLHYQGFTLYQSSYDISPGKRKASIFSVNRDPGRWVKYIGAIILVFGIAIFTVMRSRWYLQRTRLAAIFLALLSLPAMGTSARADEIDPNLDRFRDFATHIDAGVVETLPVQGHGRVKPLDTFTRETILFLVGKYSPRGELSANQAYLALITSNVSQDLQFINVRDPELRTSLGFSKSQRYFSIHQLEEEPARAPRGADHGQAAAEREARHAG